MTPRRVMARQRQGRPGRPVWPKAVALLAFLVALLALPGSAWSDDAPAGNTPSAAPQEASVADLGPPVVSLETGQPAPYAGLLMGEGRFLLYAGQQLRITELEGTLEVRETLLRETAESLAAAQTGIFEAAEPGFWARYGWVVGFAVGVAAAGLAVYAAVAVLETRTP